MLNKCFVIFIVLFILPISSEISFSNLTQFDNTLIASSRSGRGHGHSGRSSHHSSSRRHHTSSQRSHRSGGSHHGQTRVGGSHIHGGTHVTPHTSSVTSYGHPGYVPGFQTSGTVIQQPLNEGYADQIPMNPPPEPPPVIIVDDNSPQMTDDNTPQMTDNNIPQITIDNNPNEDGTPMTVVQVPKKSSDTSTPKVLTRQDIPESMRFSLFQICYKKYFDEDEHDPLLVQINENLMAICYDDLLNKFLKMMNQPKSPDSQPQPQPSPIPTPV